ETRTSTDMAGLRTTRSRNASYSATETLADGTTTATSESPDPRFGIQSSYVSSTTVTLPSGLTRNESRSRAVTLTNPQDPLSLSSLLDSITVNGRTSTSSYSATTPRITRSSAAGRVSTVDYEALGRVT